MRNETKALIIVLLMLLSVGPLMSFFGQSQLNLPDKPDGPTYHTYSGNFSVPFMAVDSYVSYWGVSPRNNRTYAEAILKNISNNYSIDVSLNPTGYGYQYSIRAYENDSDKLKEIGFRLAFDFADFFIPGDGNYPLIVGSVMLYKSLSLLTGNETKEIYLAYNQSLRVPLIYSRGLHKDVEIFCPEMVTSLNDTLVRIPQTCMDTEIPKAQQYMGLESEDINSAQIYEQTGPAKVGKPTELRLGGNYTDETNPGRLEQAVKQELIAVTAFINPLISTFSLKSNITDITMLNLMHSFCNKYNLTIAVEYKVATMGAPQAVTFDGKTYGLGRIKSLPLHVKVGTQENATIQATAKYKILYGRVIGASAKEAGLPEEAG